VKRSLLIAVLLASLPLRASGDTGRIESELKHLEAMVDRVVEQRRARDLAWGNEQLARMGETESGSRSRSTRRR
jgi:hypothetical protein